MFSTALFQLTPEHIYVCSSLYIGMYVWVYSSESNMNYVRIYAGNSQYKQSWVGTLVSGLLDDPLCMPCDMQTTITCCNRKLHRILHSVAHLWRAAYEKHVLVAVSYHQPTSCPGSWTRQKTVHLPQNWVCDVGEKCTCEWICKGPPWCSLHWTERWTDDIYIQWTKNFKKVDCTYSHL